MQKKDNDQKIKRVQITDTLESAALYLMGNKKFELKREGHYWSFYFEETDKLIQDRKDFKMKTISDPPQPKDVQLTMQWMRSLFEE